MPIPKKITEQQINQICSLMGISREDLAQALTQPLPATNTQIPQPTPRLYSRKECCKLMGISLSTLDRRIEENIIPSVKMGRKVLIPSYFLHSLNTMSGGKYAC